MATVVDLLETLNELDVHREALSAIGRTGTSILDLNREQLLHGKRSDMTEMPDYSYISVTQFGKPEGPIMLYDTGAFHGSFQLDVGPDEFEILADDLYQLEDRYGEEIYGLTETNQEYYNQEIFFPELMNAVEDLTGLRQ
jgi:hypothetical protein